jgi:CDP-diacylglycerol--serine O-phosphatidyltransferase
MKRHIPNTLTLLNLFTGLLGIVFCFDVFEWKPLTDYRLGWISPALFVWVASGFDFLDGLVARLLKVASPIGKELDSLADVVSFGVLPAVFMYKQIAVDDTQLAYAGLLIAAFSALRLAVFNLDESQQEGFKGLPTPANALFLTGLPFLSEILPVAPGAVALVAVSVVSSLLLVSRFGLFALKFKTLTWKGNELRFTFLLLSGLLLIGLKFAALPLIVLLYLLLSLFMRVADKRK